ETDMLENVSDSCLLPDSNQSRPYHISITVYVKHPDIRAHPRPPDIFHGRMHTILAYARNQIAVLFPTQQTITASARYSFLKVSLPRVYFLPTPKKLDN